MVENDTVIVAEDSSGSLILGPNVNEVEIVPHIIVFENEEVEHNPVSQQQQATRAPKPDDDDEIFTIDLETSHTLVVGTKRQTRQETSDAKK